MVMTKTKVSVAQKARYGVLFLPVLWLLFSLWIVINEATSNVSYTRTSEVNTPPSTFELVNMIYLSVVTLWFFSRILLAIKQHNAISAELKSGFAFALGLTILTINNDFHLGQFIYYIGVMLTDIAAVIVIITLLQRKSFIGTTLYHKDIQIRKV